MLKEKREFEIIVYSKVNTTKSGSPNEIGFNGYYTWARLGYVNENENYVFDAFDYVGEDEYSKLTDHIKKSRSLSELFMSEEGKKFWKENGRSFNGVFNLQDGSKSMEILNNYMEEKENE